MATKQNWNKFLWSPHNCRLFIYLFIHGKCNTWDYVTMTRDVSDLRYEGRLFCITSTLVLHQQDTSFLLQLKSKSHGFQKTAKSYQKQLKFLPLLPLTKAARVKGTFLKVKQMKFPLVLLLTKAVNGEKKTPKFKTVKTPLH